MFLHMEWIPNRKIKVVFAQVLGELELYLWTMEIAGPVSSALLMDPSLNQDEPSYKQTS